MRCTCGWKSGVELGVDGKPGVEKRMERDFVAHLPAERQTGLFVDARPYQIGWIKPPTDERDGEPQIGIRGVWIMPEGVPTRITSWYESEEVRYGVIEDGRTLPVVELRLEDGRIIRLDE